MLEKLEKEVKALFEKSDDPETIKAFTSASIEIDKARKENEEMLKRNTALMTSYKEAIINKDYGTKDVKHEDNRPVSLEEILQNTYAKRGGKEK